MKCDFCEQEFDEYDFVGLEITPQAEFGNDTGATKKTIICYDCVFKLMGFDPERIDDDEM